MRRFTVVDTQHEPRHDRVDRRRRWIDLRHIVVACAKTWVDRGVAPVSASRARQRAAMIVMSEAPQ